MALPFRYVISDMDGTILAPDHVMSAYTRDTLKQLVHEFGVTPILATGRHYADVRIVAENLKAYIWGDGTTIPNAPPPASPSRAPMLFLITSNGAVAHNAVTHEVIFQSCLDPPLAAKLFGLLPVDETVTNSNMYQNDDWICRVDWPALNDAYQESGIRFVHLPDPPPLSAEPVPCTSPTSPARGAAVGNYDNVTKVFYITNDESLLPQLVKDVQATVASSQCSPISITFSASDCLDIMADSVSKGQALRRLFSIIRPAKAGADVAEEALQASIAFGDGLNDAEMLAVVGKGCVMRNCNPKLHEQLPELEVIRPNNEDGVAKKLREVFGLPL